MDREGLKVRTKALAVSVFRAAATLPRSIELDQVRRQLVRCGGSVGANYRAACRGRSVPETVAKLGIVEEETDEVLYWIELLRELGVDSAEWRAIATEADQILRITGASIKSLRSQYFLTREEGANYDASGGAALVGADLSPEERAGVVRHPNPSHPQSAIRTPHSAIAPR